MATCVNCGKWAGLFSDRHDDCSPPLDLPKTETDELVVKLTPVILKAGFRAGIASAVTLVVICVIAVILRVIVMFILT